jgi:hypothetical protein
VKTLADWKWVVEAPRLLTFERSDVKANAYPSRDGVGRRETLTRRPIIGRNLSELEIVVYIRSFARCALLAIE